MPVRKFQFTSYHRAVQFLEVVSKPLNVIQHAREGDRTFKELGDCLMRSHNAFTFFVLFVRFVLLTFDFFAWREEH